MRPAAGTTSDEAVNRTTRACFFSPVRRGEGGVLEQEKLRHGDGTKTEQKPLRGPWGSGFGEEKRGPEKINEKRRKNKIVRDVRRQCFVRCQGLAAAAEKVCNINVTFSVLVLLHA